MFSNWNSFEIECNKGLFLDVNLKKGFLKGKTAKVNKKFLSDLASKLLLLFKKKFDESAQTYVLEKISPLNSISSKFSDFDV